MSRRLRGEEIVTIDVLTRRGQNNCEIARTLGITEGAVRYQLKRLSEGREDGRKSRASKADEVAEVIAHWVRTHEETGVKRPVNVKDLYQYLVNDHDYEGHYRSVLRYVRAHYPKPKLRTYRRVETPPGAQTQTDWGEYPMVDVGSGPQPMHLFVQVLSHSRYPEAIWSESENQLSWLHCHNEAYRRLKGVAAVNRSEQREPRRQLS